MGGRLGEGRGKKNIGKCVLKYLGGCGGSLPHQPQSHTDYITIETGTGSAEYNNYNLQPSCAVICFNVPCIVRYNMLQCSMYSAL